MACISEGQAANIYSHARPEHDVICCQLRVSYTDATKIMLG